MTPELLPPELELLLELVVPASCTVAPELELAPLLLDVPLPELPPVELLPLVEPPLLDAAPLLEPVVPELPELLPVVPEELPPFGAAASLSPKPGVVLVEPHATTNAAHAVADARTLRTMDPRKVMGTAGSGSVMCGRRQKKFGRALRLETSSQRAQRTSRATAVLSCRARRTRANRGASCGRPS